MKLLYLFLFLFLLSCAASTKPLEERGWSQKQRISYMEMNKDCYPAYLQDDFINKNLSGAYDKELIIYLIGRPNKYENEDIWIYLDKDGKSLLKIEFKGNRIISFSY
jgi:hypothetical protein